MKKYLPLALSLSLLLCFFYFGLFQDLRFENLAKHRLLLLQWKEDNYLLAVFFYTLAYTLAVTASLPGALFFSMAGGFLFGLFPGVLYVLFSITLGSTLLYLSIKLAFADWAQKKVEKRFKQVERGFQENAFYYLLSLRLVPVFPCFLVNIMAGLLNLSLPLFVSATFLGLVPGVIIYTALGENLGSLLEQPSFSFTNFMLQPRFLLPLFGLAFLALMPIIVQYFKKEAP